MTEYVLGFMFDTIGNVVLIRKKRPEWQAGLLNGVGGKIEKDELHQNAMSREFGEETGVKTLPANWLPFCTMVFPGEMVYCLTRISDVEFSTAITLTDEEIVFLAQRQLDGEDVVPNLRWLVPMAWNALHTIPACFYTRVDHDLTYSPNLFYAKA